jgi:hypothetical protein
MVTAVTELPSVSENLSLESVEVNLFEASKYS